MKITLTIIIAIMIALTLHPTKPKPVIVSHCFVDPPGWYLPCSMDPTERDI